MILGIDLGTTHSLVGVFQDGAPRLLPNANGSLLTPSVVSVGDDGLLLVGAPARERLLTFPAQTAACFKRYMGTDRGVRLGDREFRPEELSALVLRSLKADAEAALGTPVSRAVVTVPAYFRDAQRKATRIAAEMAGLEIDRLLNEPTAAALAYGIHEIGNERKILVLDLGGGTFDVSILDYFEGVMEVRATAGDNHLGGEDFVDVLLEHFVRTSGIPVGSARLNDSANNAVLRKQMENAKRLLTAQPEAVLNFRLGDSEIEWRVTRREFEEAARPLLARLRTPIERALRDARIHAHELDEILPVGGATRMPMIREMTARLFGRLPGFRLSPDEAIGLGAAVQAGLRMRNEDLKEIVLTDVAPYSLGVEVVERLEGGQIEAGLFQPILERNTIIPASRVSNFSTVGDRQTNIDIKIYQGESRFVRENVFLGRLGVKVPAARAGEQAVDVRFTYDANGILEVEALVRSTGETRTIVIEENPGVLSSDEIRTRLVELAGLKIHPRDQLNNASVVQRAKRVYEESLGARRDLVGHLLAAFLGVLDRQEPGAIETARKEFEARLEELDQNPFI